MKYPVVYYYKEDGSKGEDLKYSIRSVIKNFPYSQILILGDKPSWFKETERITHIPSVNNKTSSWTLGWVPFQHMLTLIKNAKFDDFILFNDDFYVTKKIDEFYDMCRSEADYELRARVNRVYNKRTMQSLKFTKSKKYFNLHAPMRMKVSRLKSLLDWWLKSNVKDLDFRTLYGNLYIEDYSKLVEVADFKSSFIRPDLLDPTLRDYYSTSSSDFREPCSEVAKKIKEMFPEKSPCEKIFLEKIK